VLAVLSDPQARALNPDGGKTCPTHAADGGIPGGGPSFSALGHRVWSVSLVGVNQIQIEVLGTICDPAACPAPRAMR
jgi:hypothetical protein